jgi:hypothetical protein
VARIVEQTKKKTTRERRTRPRRRTPRLTKKRRLEQLFRTPESDEMDWTGEEESEDTSDETEYFSHELD